MRRKEREICDPRELEAIIWSEPLRMCNELSNINPWRDDDEEIEAALQPRIQDIGSYRT